VLVSSPSESHEQQTATTLAAPLPWGLLGDGLGALPKIARRCLLCPVSRSGSLGLSRILPGLALDSVTQPERTFEVFRSTSLTCPHRCGSAIDPLCRSPSELPFCCPDRLTPVTSRGVGRGQQVTLPPLPSAPPSTALSDASLEVTVCVYSRSRTFAPVLRPRVSTPEVPFRPRGFAPPRRFTPHPARGLVASRCRPWGSSRFLLGRNRAFPATLPPLEELHRPAVGTPVTRRLGPLDVPPLARLSPSRLFPSNRPVTSVPVAGRRCPVLPGLLCPLRGFREIVFSLVPPSPGESVGRAHRR